MDDDYEGGGDYYDDESGEAPGSYTPKGSVFRRILDSAKESIHPDFAEEAEGTTRDKSNQRASGEMPEGGHNTRASQGMEEARKRLKSGEEAASTSANNEDKLSDAEKKDSGFVSNVGKFTKAGAMANLMRGGKKKKKKKGLAATFASSCLVLAIMFGVFGSQTSTLFQLVENVKQIHDTITASKRMRTRAFYRYQADTSNGRVKKSCKSKVFNGDKFRLNPDGKMAKKLARQGIEVDQDGKTMHWTDTSGKKYDIVTDKHYKSMIKGTEAEKARALADYKAKHGAELVGYEDLYSTNNQFRDSAYTALRTLKGAFHDLYSGIGKKVFQRLGGIKRFIFDDFKPDADDAVDDVANRIQNPEEFEVKIKAGDIEETDPNDPAALRGTLENDDGSTRDGALRINNDEVETTKAKPGDGEEIVNKIAEKQKKSASSLLMTGVNLTCVGIDLVNSAYLVAYGIQVGHAVQEAVSFIEGVEMAKTEEYAAHSPYHQLGQMVEKQTSKTITRLKDIDIENETSEYETVDVKGRFSDSPSVAGIISGEPVNPLNDIAQNYQITAGFTKFRDRLKISLSSHMACTQARRIAAIAGVAIDSLKALACVFGGCEIAVADIFGGIARGTKISLLIAGIVAIVTPIIENAILVGTSTAFLGPEKGEAFAHGAKKAFNSIGVAESHGLKTPDSLNVAFLKQQEIIAEDAEYDRRHLSPFDTSSQHTFMGSLVKSMAQIRSSNSIVSAISSVSSVFVGSINKLMPTASAIDASEKSTKIITYSSETCASLTSIGGVGDQFCEPYIGTDFSTIEEDPADVVNAVDDLGQFDGEENDQPVIKKDSELAQYIIYCNQRTSPYGVADINISNSIGDWQSYGTIPDAVTGSIPIVGDIIDIVQNQDKLDHWAYISGEACVEGNNNTSSKVPTWETTKKYQRFIEDQYLAESEDLIPEGSNPVEKFIAEYYEEHPLDNSYEGIIARYSGQTKETVIAFLNEFEFEEWLASYDPSDLYPTPNPEEEIENFQYEGERPIIASVDAVIRSAFSEERRQRNFAA